MSPMMVSSIVFTCTFGGALLGMWLRTALPAHHLDVQSRDTVKVGGWAHRHDDRALLGTRHGLCEEFL